LVLTTALISGLAIFFNKFALSCLPSSDVFTFLKNVIVTVFLLAGIGFFTKFKELKNLKNKDWGMLILIGLVGGSVPFLLFFQGLTFTSASSAAMIHKTLFVWVSLLALVFLKEKLGNLQIAALGLLLLGNILILGLPKIFSWNRGETLILLATFLWAIENVIAKYALKNLSGEIVAFGRMFFGGLVLFIYLLFTQQVEAIAAVNRSGWIWTLVSAGILFGYVFTWYKGLKLLPASIAASILVIASVVTSILSAVFIKHTVSLTVILGALLIIVAVFIIVRRFFFAHPGLVSESRKLRNPESSRAI